MEEFPCPKCRSLNEKSAVFCRQCGCNIEAVKRRKKIFKIAFFVIFLALLTTGAICAIVDYVDQKEHDEWWARKIYAIGHYDKIDDFNEGLAKVKLNGRYGFINEEYEEVIPLIYDGATIFSEGLAAVGKDYRWGFIDHLGNEVIPLIYDDAIRFSDGLAGVKKGDSWGFINRYNEIVIPYKFREVTFFKNGESKVWTHDMDRRKIDKNGDFID